MRPYFLLLLTFCCLSVYSQTGSLRCLVKSESYENMRIEVYNSLNNDLVMSAEIDTSLLVISNLSPANYQVKLVDSAGNELLTPKEVLVVEGEISFLSMDASAVKQKCLYSKEKKKPKCHICNKKSHVIPYVYGLPDKDCLARNEEQKIKLGGCITYDCAPRWYCTKDKTDVLENTWK